MRKRGFTLAEVMLALALIGVIASLTIPTFIANSRNKSNAAKLATAITAVENAFVTMIATEAVNDLSETAFGESPTADNLGKYLKLAGSGDMANYYGNGYPYNNIKGNLTRIHNNIEPVYQTKNGVLLAFIANNVDETGSHPGSIGRLIIDVNAAAKPNVWGRDAFLFRIGKDGLLYPAGGQKCGLMDKNVTYSCDKNTKDEGCTATLVENNFEITY